MTPSKGVGAQRPPNYWDFLHARTQYEKQQPNCAMCMVIKLVNVRQIFTRSTTNADARSVRSSQPSYFELLLVLVCYAFHLQPCVLIIRADVVR